LEDNLRIEGYRTFCAQNCREAMRQIREHQPDLIVLDLMLPDGDGIDLCRQIRSEGFFQTILLVTARGTEMDKVIGLEAGADDYLTKPFSLRELLARISAHLRRNSVWRDNPGWVSVGAARVDFQRHILERDGTELECSAREFALLHYLVERRGQAVSRQTLLEVVWGQPDTITTRTVDNFIVRLRKKIERDPATPHTLVTIHGSGYKLLRE
jgi:DNA-binding response OmpR family regulator